MSESLPSREDVFAYVSTHEPTTAQAVADGLGVEWSSRTTVRNRLNDLVAEGRLIVDEDRRPMVYAVNGLMPPPDAYYVMTPDGPDGPHSRAVAEHLLAYLVEGDDEFEYELVAWFHVEHAR